MHREMLGNTDFVFRRVEEREPRDNIYRLRYQVYCNECHFIRPEDCPQGLEEDKYDQYSLHFVAEDPEGLIGTSRLILNSPLKFPMLEHCDEKYLTIDRGLLYEKNAAEVSRLVISKTYRRRRNDGLYYGPDFDDTVRHEQTGELIKRIRPMAFGLYREMYQESKRKGITRWFAVMEKSLYFLLRMHNFVFKPIGPEIDYYGTVTPYMAELSEIEQIVSQKSPQIFSYFLAGLEPDFLPQVTKSNN